MNTIEHFCDVHGVNPCNCDSWSERLEKCLGPPVLGGQETTQQTISRLYEEKEHYKFLAMKCHVAVQIVKELLRFTGALPKELSVRIDALLI